MVWEIIESRIMNLFMQNFKPILFRKDICTCRLYSKYLNLFNYIFFIIYLFHICILTL